MYLIQKGGTRGKGNEGLVFLEQSLFSTIDCLETRPRFLWIAVHECLWGWGVPAVIISSDRTSRTGRSLLFHVVIHTPGSHCHLQDSKPWWWREPQTGSNILKYCSRKALPQSVGGGILIIAMCLKNNSGFQSKHNGDAFFRWIEPTWRERSSYPLLLLQSKKAILVPMLNYPLKVWQQQKDLCARAKTCLAFSVASFWISLNHKTMWFFKPQDRLDSLPL